MKVATRGTHLPECSWTKARGALGKDKPSCLRIPKGACPSFQAMEEVSGWREPRGSSQASTRGSEATLRGKELSGFSQGRVGGPTARGGVQVGRECPSRRNTV